jgi:hypothetical protein
MRFQECREGDYKIFAGAVEAPRGDGYIAAVVVSRVEPGPGQPSVAFRDDSVACGYRWRSPEEAIAYALNRAREMVRRQSGMLTC